MEDRYLKFLVAVLITAMIMATAALVSQYVNQSQITAMSNGLKQVQSGIQSLQLATLLGDSNSSYSCAILSSGLSSLSSQLSVLGGEAQASDVENKSGPQYIQLVSNLEYTRIEYWLVAQKISSQCGGGLTTVLMFYSPVNCGSCVVEGDELGYLSSLYGNMSYVGVDGSFNMSVVDTLNHVYNLTASDYPAVVINGKYVVKGYRTTQQLKSYLCRYTNASNFCGAA